MDRKDNTGALFSNKENKKIQGIITFSQFSYFKNECMLEAIYGKLQFMEKAGLLQLLMPVT